MKPLPPSTYPGAHAVVEFNPGELVTLALATGAFDDAPAGVPLHLVYTTGGSDAPPATGGKTYAPGVVAAVGLAVRPATAAAPAFLAVESDFTLTLIPQSTRPVL